MENQVNEISGEVCIVLILDSPSVVHVGNLSKVADEECRTLLGPAWPNIQLTERYNLNNLLEIGVARLQILYVIEAKKAPRDCLCNLV